MSSIPVRLTHPYVVNHSSYPIAFFDGTKLQSSKCHEVQNEIYHVFLLMAYHLAQALIVLRKRTCFAGRRGTVAVCVRRTSPFYIIPSSKCHEVQNEIYHVFLLMAYHLAQALLVLWKRTCYAGRRGAVAVCVRRTSPFYIIPSSKCHEVQNEIHHVFLLMAYHLAHALLVLRKRTCYAGRRGCSLRSKDFAFSTLFKVQNATSFKMKYIMYFCS